MVEGWLRWVEEVNGEVQRLRWVFAVWEGLDLALLLLLLLLVRAVEQGRVR